MTGPAAPTGLTAVARDQGVEDFYEARDGRLGISLAVEKIGGVPRTVLNGERVFMMATLDQGFWPDGVYTAPSGDALRAGFIAGMRGSQRELLSVGVTFPDD